jgi:riboflavin synthase alpha subunit
MFTGIITDIGRIEAIEARGTPACGSPAHTTWTSVAMGASIACSACA